MNLRIIPLGVLLAAWPAGARADLPDLRLFAPGTARKTIEKAHPECRQFREKNSKGSKCTVHSVRYDKEGVQHSLGWCMKNTYCVPRWEYSFDPGHRLRRVDLHIGSTDANGVLFREHPKLTRRIYTRLVKTYGKPAYNRDLRRTRRQFERLSEDTRMRLRRAVWRTKTVRVLMSADAVAYHHPVVRTRVVVRLACPACKKKRRRKK